MWERKVARKVYLVNRLLPCFIRPKRETGQLHSRKYICFGEKGVLTPCKIQTSRTSLLELLEISEIATKWTNRLAWTLATIIISRTVPMQRSSGCVPAENPLSRNATTGVTTYDKTGTTSERSIYTVDIFLFLLALTGALNSSERINPEEKFGINPKLKIGIWVCTKKR